MDEAVQSPTSRAKRCILMELPAELRNYIYTFALVDEGPIVIEPCIIGPQRVHQPALTRAARQIRLETLPIFYGQNIFEFDIQEHNLKIKTHLTMIPESRLPLLNNIQVRKCGHEEGCHTLKICGKPKGTDLIRSKCTKETLCFTDDKLFRYACYLLDCMELLDKEGLKLVLLMLRN